VMTPDPVDYALGISTAHAWANNHEVPCRLHVPSTSVEVVSQYARTHAVRTFGVDSIRQLTDLTDVDAESVVVARPQTHAELRLAADVLVKDYILWSIDHYVHAEQIGAAGFRHLQSVLIQLQAAQPGVGVRPGTDALQLARGIERLDGVRVEGLAVYASGNDPVESALQAAQHTRDKLLLHGICCDTVSLSTEPEFMPSHRGLITELYIDVPRAGSTSASQHTARTATVVSRPSLEHVVVVIDDIATERRVVFPDHPQAHVTRWHRDCCVIAATGPAGRLNIGDTLRVTVLD
jgi:D-serine deaminase-like pyridoxal phosphate-dependent protein